VTFGARPDSGAFKDRAKSPIIGRKMRYPDFAGGGCKSPQERLCLIRCLSLLDVISFVEYFLPFFVMVKALGSTKVLIYPEVRTGAIKKLSP
jgi:hypothetical protein